MILLTSFAGILVTGAVLTALGLHNAPEGYEDETGFNYLWQNNAPEIPNVACIWTYGSDSGLHGAV